MHHAEAIWRAGLEAVRPERLIRDHVRIDGDALVAGGVRVALPRHGRIEIVGAGKGAGGLADALTRALEPTGRPLAGLLSVPAPLAGRRGDVVWAPGRPAGWNLPHPDGAALADRMLDRVAGLGPDDLLLVVLTGGASALLPAPVAGVSLEDLTALTVRLAASGAGIAELNTVRGALSRIARGGLLRATGAGRTLGLIVSDVIGDDLATIGSGPTVDGPHDPAAAREILRVRGLWDAAPPVVRDALSAARPVGAERTRCDNVLLASNATAVTAAAAEASRRGFTVLDLGTRPDDDPERLVDLLAGLARGVRDRGEPVAPPVCLVAGGEPVVSLPPGAGRGGRNQHLGALFLRRFADTDLHDVHAVLAGTDGEDGPTDAAGARLDPSLRVAADALDHALATRATYDLLDAHDALLRTGLTGTNVADLWVVTIGAPSGPGGAPVR